MNRFLKVLSAALFSVQFVLSPVIAGDRDLISNVQESRNVQTRIGLSDENYNFFALLGVGEELKKTSYWNPKIDEWQDAIYVQAGTQVSLQPSGLGWIQDEFNLVLYPESSTSPVVKWSACISNDIQASNNNGNSTSSVFSDGSCVVFHENVIIVSVYGGFHNNNYRLGLGGSIELTSATLH